ncbi:MAG: radical SAM protein, partial [Candidatus Bathyarchaeota archaeon]
MLPSDIFKLKVELQSEGLHSESIHSMIFKKSGAGPSGMISLTLPGNHCAWIPATLPIFSASPNKLHAENGKFLVAERFFDKTPVEVTKMPNFYSKITSKGIPMHKLGLLHGKDCIGTTINPNCYYWKIDKPCHFCGIEAPVKAGHSIGEKDPNQFIEVLDEAKKEGLCNHVTLTTGATENKDEEIAIYSTFVRKVKEVFDIPIHVQLTPPKNLERLSELSDAGVDTVGINIESLDPMIFNKICPGKARDNGRSMYANAWKAAINIFGEAQVSSFVIMGLGENMQVTLLELEKMVRFGCVPFITSFTPVVGSLMETISPPSFNYMLETYRSVATIIRKYGLDLTKSKAGCVRCHACSAL